MMSVRPLPFVILLATAVSTACSSAPRAAPDGSPKPISQKELRKVMATATPKATRADVSFMQGMIPHHAQAVLIAGWAASHGARLDIARLCERIVVAQRDEIALMRGWLRDRGEEVPAADAKHMMMTMNGVEHPMLMPGMLTDEQLSELDTSRGSEFDRLFLSAMIAHHNGAVSMVDDLFGAANSAQDEVVFKFASDVYADQTTEIDFMQKMLETVPRSVRKP